MWDDWNAGRGGGGDAGPPGWRGPGSGDGPARRGGRHGGPEGAGLDARGFGWGGAWGGPGPRGRHGHHGGRDFGRRGVRLLMLDLLSEAPRHGYDIIQEIGQRSGGLWQPSPGSVYPTLQQLEDEGLVRAQAVDGRRVYELTDAGRSEVERNRAAQGDPWQRMAAVTGSARVRLGAEMRQVMAACAQVIRAGTEAQQLEAAQMLAETRRQLYGLLGSGDPGLE